MAPSTLVSSLLVAALAASSALATTVNTPTGLVTCQPSALSWTGGTAPYYLSILPGGQASAAPIESFASTSAMSYTWIVDLAAGTSITLALKDSTGVTVYSDIAVIQAGTDTSCIGASSSTPGITTSTRASSTTGSSSSGAAATTSSGAASTTTSSSSSSSSAPSATVTGGASRTTVVGAAGLVAGLALVLAA